MCYPACLNMIFKRRGLNTYSQLQIASSLGLKIPPSLKNKYPETEVSDDETQWGVHPDKDNSLQRFINDNSIDLYFKFLNLRSIPSNTIIDCINDNLEKGNDIIVGYDYATVFEAGENVGHVSLLSSLNEVANTVQLVDPEVPHPIEVCIKKLLKGIYKRYSGFWIFIRPGEHISIDYI